MSGSLPKLAELYEKYADKRDRLEILAFHDDSVKTIPELQEKLAGIKEKYWKGKDLPFPILLDASGATVRTWGIKAFPTIVLIDPEGKVVGEFWTEDLEERLREALP